MPQDPAVELLQRLAGLQAQLVREQAPRRVVDAERVRLPAGPVQREHEVFAQPLPKWVPRDQLIQLRHERGVSPQGEIRANSVLDREQSQLFETGSCSG